MLLFSQLQFLFYCSFSFFFFFNDTATTEIYTLSLHDALPISIWRNNWRGADRTRWPCARWRSEEHTSELQSQSNLVCRLLLEKKKKKHYCPVTKQKTRKKLSRREIKHRV